MTTLEITFIAIKKIQLMINNCVKIFCNDITHMGSQFWFSSQAAHAAWDEAVW